MPAEPADPLAPLEPLRTDADVASYRMAMGRLVTGVTVVTTFAGIHDHAMTANAVTSVSLDPVLMLVCVEQDARFHDAVLESGLWGVSILTAGSRPAAVWLASPGRPMHGQLDSVPHHRGPVTGVALLDGALARIECRTTAVHPAGDHSIVVGAVVGIEVPQANDLALTYYRGGYGAVR